jgi:hypothetical protein
LSNVENLYSTVETPIVVAAEISLSENFDILPQFKAQFDVIEQEFLAI